MRRSVAILFLTFTAIAVFFAGSQNSHSYAAAQATAQATASAANCDLSSVFKGASALKSSGDTTKDLVALLDLSRTIQDANVACTAMTFSGSGNFSSDVFDFNVGVYKVTVNEPTPVNDGYFAVDLLPVDKTNKNCGEQFMFQDNLPKGKTTMSSSSDYHTYSDSVTSCRVTMKVSTSSDWTLSFTLLK